MKKSILLLLLLLCFIVFQFQGCGDEINNIITYDTTAVTETIAVFVDTGYVTKESDSRIRMTYWLYCYSNNNNISFHVDTSYVYDYSDLLISIQEINEVISENCMWPVGYNIDGDFQHVTASDSFLIKVDYRIIELLGVSDTGFVYEVLRDSTTSRWASVFE